MVDVAKGKFERTDAENYDEFLKALDVNFLLRKAATASTPVMEVRISYTNLHFKDKISKLLLCTMRIS